MLQVVANDLIDFREFQTREILDNLLRRDTPVECMDYAIESYASSGNPINAVFILRQPKE